MLEVSRVTELTSQAVINTQNNNFRLIGAFLFQRESVQSACIEAAVFYELTSTLVLVWNNRWILIINSDWIKNDTPISLAPKPVDLNALISDWLDVQSIRLTSSNQPKSFWIVGLTKENQILLSQLEITDKSHVRLIRSHTVHFSVTETLFDVTMENVERFFSAENEFSLLVQIRSQMSVRLLLMEENSGGLIDEMTFTNVAQLKIDSQCGFLAAICDGYLQVYRLADLNKKPQSCMTWPCSYLGLDSVEVLQILPDNPDPNPDCVPYHFILTSDKKAQIVLWGFDFQSRSHEELIRLEVRTGFPSGAYFAFNGLQTASVVSNEGVIYILDTGRAELSELSTSSVQSLNSRLSGLNLTNQSGGEKSPPRLRLSGKIFLDCCLDLSFLGWVDVDVLVVKSCLASDPINGFQLI